MPTDIKTVIDAEKKVVKPKTQGLKSNPSDVAAVKKLKMQKAKEDLDALNKGVLPEDSEEKKKKSVKENTVIANLLKAISQKNYAQADKYLQSAVDSKLKASISKAVENSK
jgi:hypothetical protein